MEKLSSLKICTFPKLKFKFSDSPLKFPKKGNKISLNFHIKKGKNI